MQILSGSLLAKNSHTVSTSFKSGIFWRINRRNMSVATFL